jgi:phosphopantothenoylcysteine decarboxylase/phosphopantothenate--cysteine ligase
MAEAVARHAAGATALVMAAAVSDYRPASVAPRKLKKGEGPVTLPMVRTPDILASLADSKGDRIHVGFAAETEDLRESARRKLAEKRLDLIVANDVTADGAGFAGETNRAVLIDAGGGETEVGLRSKRELAELIWDRVVELLRGRKG